MTYSNHSTFFFNDTATTEIYTLSLHDALPIFPGSDAYSHLYQTNVKSYAIAGTWKPNAKNSQESQELNYKFITEDRKSTRLNSSPRQYLVCRLLLEKKNIPDMKSVCLDATIRY